MSNFELRTDPTMLWIRDYATDTTTTAYLNPTNSDAIVLGEWFELTAATDGKKVARASGSIPSYCFYAERGRTDIQMTGRIPLLVLGGYIADTKIMSATGVVVGGLLKVGTVAFSGVNRSALVQHTGAADTDFVVGHAIRLPSANNNYLQFQKVDPNRLV